MGRTVIHYDEVTECGLLRDAGGSLRYFRKGDADDPAVDWHAEPSPMPLRTDPVRRDPVRHDPTPIIAQTINPGVNIKERSTPLMGVKMSWINWAGILLSGMALLLLINAGGKGLNPKLIDSWWGISAAILLMIQLIFFSIGVAASKLRTNYWRIVVCTLLASLLLKSCDNYRADTTADVYSITLGLLLLVVYLLPKQQGR